MESQGHAIVFIVPLVALSVAAWRSVLTAKCVPAARPVWLAFGLMSTLAAVASAAALLSGVTGLEIFQSLYLGSAASVVMVVGTGLLLFGRLPRAHLDGILEALMFIGLGGALSVYFVIVPGFQSGDALLTAILVADLVALALALLAALGCWGGQTVGWALVGAIAAATVGDGVVSAGSSGQAAALTDVTALTWAMAGATFAWAAYVATEADSDEDLANEKWFASRIALPFAGVVALPEIAIGIWFTQGLTTFSAVFFASTFVAVLLLVFVRQAHLLRSNRRALARERRMVDEMGRRNSDLQALTGLATTMNQSLEDERPIIAQGLDMLALGARATGACLWAAGDEGTVVLGRSGDGPAGPEPTKAAVLSAEYTAVEERNDQTIIRLALSAHGSRLGVVSLARPASDPLGEGELGRLQVLANQLSIAIQNARDYRDKLEQAMRDPLTGVYNRRFFYEALEREVGRAGRYGAPVSLVLFDVDDFKEINDTLGHARGDDALRRVTALALGQIRDVDSFARIGGEEFALLLPETHRLDALLVADRVRLAVARHCDLVEGRVTLSAGVACCPQDGATPEELERQADSALYWAKRNGKNICAIASDVTDAESERDGSSDVPAPLAALVSTLDSQSLYTREHAEKVAACAVAIGQQLGLNEVGLLRLRRAAFLHDIGKIAVPPETLAKPRADLSEAERDRVRTHPGVGLSILAYAGLGEEAEWVGQHHERVDGGGYPRGLRGDQIALEGRIIGVADAFEAMTAERPHRPRLPVAAALVELRRCAGTQFDAEVVTVITELVERDELALRALRA